MTSLEEYRRKRDFKKTSEPPPVKAKSAKPSKAKALSFVIQKHDASRLHYDFRLEMDGVLKSWAVPKGPSLDPSDKRLAVMTEDHPLAYGGFEGTIPEGEYGAGAVILWDHGTYEPEGDPLAALARGRLTFTLRGEKLHGRFHLVRTRGDAKAARSSRDGESKSWLLIKATDDDVRSGVGVEQLDARSVTTGRTIEDVDLAPELCTPVKAPPEGDAWLHEPKIDGYRILAKKDGARVELLTRNGLDWTERFPAVADAVKKLRPTRAILDGEIAVVDEKGAASFGALQRAIAGADPGAATVYFAFDLLSLEGNDLRSRPLSERKERLAEVLPSSTSRKKVTAIERVPFVVGHGDAFLEEMKKQGLEGMVSKRVDSLYVGERTREWLKLRLSSHEEFVVVGYTPEKNGNGLGALLVATNEGDFRGKVGTGFSQKDRKELLQKLAPLAGKKPDEHPRVPHATWVEPQLVVEVEYKEVTSDGRLRHPAFLGVRRDKTRLDEGPARRVWHSRRTDTGRATTPTHTAASPSPSPSPSRSRTAVGRDPASRVAAASKTARRAPATAPTTARKVDAAVLTRTDSPAGVSITHPERVLFNIGDKEISKLAVAHFVEATAPLMLPHVKGRPLAVVRCPNGSGAGVCFFQKHAMKGMPEVIHTVGVGKGEEEMLAVDDAAGLVGLVQMGVLEFHSWGAREGDPETPDRVVMDIDPGEGLDWERVVEAAHKIRAKLEERGLVSFAKTTGGKGLHVVVPLTEASTWDEVKTFAHKIAIELEREEPDKYTSNMKKSERVGRVFVDYLRNGRGATAVAPYSIRARPGAKVAVPVAWDELDDVRGDTFDVLTLGARLDAVNDPWAEYFEVKQGLTSSSPSSSSKAPRKTAKASTRSRARATRRG